MRWEEAPEIKRKIKTIVSQLGLEHVRLQKVICYRSFGSKSRARARIWSLPKVWQLALGAKPHYIIEVLHEGFDRLSSDNKTRVLIHELLHIPKNFSGNLVQHKGRYHKIDEKRVEKMFRRYKENF